MILQPKMFIQSMLILYMKKYHYKNNTPQLLNKNSLTMIINHNLRICTVIIKSVTMLLDKFENYQWLFGFSWEFFVYLNCSISYLLGKRAFLGLYFYFPS